jgi:hypothetical protein
MARSRLPLAYAQRRRIPRGAQARGGYQSVNSIAGYGGKPGKGTVHTHHKPGGGSNTTVYPNGMGGGGGYSVPSPSAGYAATQAAASGGGGVASAPAKPQVSSFARQLIGAGANPAGTLFGLIAGASALRPNRPRPRVDVTNTEDDADRRRLAANAGTERRNRGARPNRFVKVGVPSEVPQQYRRHVAKFGTTLVGPALKAQGVKGISGAEYLGRLLKFESGFNRNAVSPVGARDLGQFMPGTEQSFIDQYGVDPVGGSAKDAIKGAAMHLSGKYGHPALYAGYNPGYSDTDPILSTDAGPSVNVRVKRKAVRGFDVDQGASPVRKAAGAWGGSQRRMRQLLGPKITRTQDWKDKEARGYRSLHDTTGNAPLAFASDLPPEEWIVDRIARKLGKENPGISPKSVDYGRTGLESGLTFKGYDVEFLPYDHGGGPHVHVGLEWTGGSAPKGTYAGAAGGAGGGFGAPYAAAIGGGGVPAVTAAAEQVAQSGTRSQRRGASELLAALSGGGGSAGSAPRTQPFSARAPMPRDYASPLTEEEEEEEDLPLYELLRRGRR